MAGLVCHRCFLDVSDASVLSVCACCLLSIRRTESSNDRGRQDHTLNRLAACNAAQNILSAMHRRVDQHGLRVCNLCVKTQYLLRRKYQKISRFVSGREETKEKCFKNHRTHLANDEWAGSMDDVLAPTKRIIERIFAQKICFEKRQAVAGILLLRNLYQEIVLLLVCQRTNRASYVEALKIREEFGFMKIPRERRSPMIWLAM